MAKARVAPVHTQILSKGLKAQFSPRSGAKWIINQCSGKNKEHSKRRGLDSCSEFLLSYILG